MKTATIPHVTFDDDETNRPIAYIHKASPKAVKTVLAAAEGDTDGRSEYVWLRLPNGDPILGVFPRGDTYFAVEDDAAFPWAADPEGSIKSEAYFAALETKRKESAQ